MESSLPFNRVSVHPVVLLSVVDHYNRVNKDSEPKRVIGILMGEIKKGVADIVSSFAVPFEETDDVWYFDRNYCATMISMLHKVSAKEKILGWYSTGPKIRPLDMEINTLVSQITPNPVFIVVDAEPKAEQLELPLKAYVALPDISEDMNITNEQVGMKFAHIPFGIEEVEAESIGVGQLLRDLQSGKSEYSAEAHVEDKRRALRAMKEKLQIMREYVRDVIDGKIPANDKVLEQIQEVFNLLPKVAEPEEHQKALCVKNNELMMGIYLGALAKVIVSLHELILNKYERKMSEEKKEKKHSEEKKKDDKKKEEKKDEEKKEEKKKEDGSDDMKD